MPTTAQIHNSEDSFTVNDGEFVLDAALRQGLALPYGCQSGGCGACRIRLINGRLQYEDDIPPPALSPAEQAAGFALICTAQASSDICIELEELPNHHAIRVRNLPARVKYLKRLCHDVMALSLQLPGNDRLDYLPGQYIDLLLRDGSRRSFSIANAPGTNDTLELHVRLVEGGVFTEQVFNSLKPGSLLRFEGPLGGFYLRDSDKPAILMAGGTGFAPIKAIMEQAMLSRSSRPMHLYWGARAKHDLYQHELATQWARARPNIAYTPVLSTPDDSDKWAGKTGWVHETVLNDYPDLSGHELYMSGPPPMITSAKRAFLANGLPAEALHYDSFDFSWELGSQPSPNG